MLRNETKLSQAKCNIQSCRIDSLINNLGQASPAAVYNRLLCPQCITQNLAIFTLIVSNEFDSL